MSILSSDPYVTPTFNSSTGYYSGGTFDRRLSYDTMGRLQYIGDQYNDTGKIVDATEPKPMYGGKWVTFQNGQPKEERGAHKPDELPQNRNNNGVNAMTLAACNALGYPWSTVMKKLAK